MEEVAVREFVQKHHDALSVFAVDGGATSEHVFIGFLDPVSKSYVRDAVESNFVSMELIDYFLFQYREATRFHSAYEATMPDVEAVAKLRTSLLLAETLGKDFSMLTPSNAISQGKLISDVIVGCSYRAKVDDRPAYTRITTEEELASLTAVTALVMEGYRQSGPASSMLTRMVFEVSTGDDRNGIMLVNHSLDKFLRKNPHEVHRVIAYARDRDVGKTVDDTARVISYLQETEELGPVSDGWL
jgi:hypothetical protein